MKTEEEIKEKYEELNKQMKDKLPTEKDIQELITNRENSAISSIEILEKMLSKSTDSISIDAQRFILEWVLGD